MVPKFLQRNKTPSAPVSRLASPVAPLNTFPVLASNALLAPHTAAISRIEELAGVPAAYFRDSYLAPLHHYARFVQQLPASEVHHHAHAGGLLEHTLEVVSTALSLRQGYLLPPGVAVEALVHLKDVWTYAVFTAALCHDLAKPAVDQKVTLYDVAGQSIGVWDPWRGDLDGNADTHWYGVEFVRNRSYRLHEKASLLLVHRIIPATGLAWLASDRQAFAAWCGCISGDASQADVLGEIISLADRHSVGHSLGVNLGPKAATSQVVPLHEKLTMALRQLIEENTLPLNRNGAAGFRTGNKLWLVSKRTVDSMRLYLTQSGHSGIPTENQRLFDVLQEHQVLEANQDRAIWRMTVQGDGWAHDLTLICIPLIKIWSNTEAWPSEFTGSVTVQRTDSGALESDALNPLEDDEDLLSTDQVTETTKTQQQEGDNNPIASKSAVTPKPNKTKAIDTGISESKDTARVIKKTGDAFLDWIIAGIQDRSVDYNNTSARIHVVNEGVLLLSPGIFQDYVKVHQLDEPWESIQKKFLKLDLHERTAGGFNIHRYRVSGDNQNALITALLLKDVGLLFKTGKPRPNPHVIKYDAQ
jgi:integrating conjugative element relaxase (TIGR03760 family)